MIQFYFGMVAVTALFITAFPTTIDPTFKWNTETQYVMREFNTTNGLYIALIFAIPILLFALFWPMVLYEIMTKRVR